VRRYLRFPRRRPPTPALPDGERSSRRSGAGSFWRELPILIVVALVLALLVKTFLAQAFYIPSASMENTLQGGDPVTMLATSAHPFDRVLVNKLVYDFRDPRRGEIVVFTQPPGWPNAQPSTASTNPIRRFLHRVATTVGLAPSSGSDFIKRVIGIPGDHVVCCNAHHQITVNGKALTEPYVDLESGSSASAFIPFDITVPDGELFVMGDHRNDSQDSRVHGPVPISDVVGRAFLVIWPLKDGKTLPVPATFHSLS
jgi:signal peptidase I